jgi:hypothetical protein
MSYDDKHCKCLNNRKITWTWGSRRRLYLTLDFVSFCAELPHVRHIGMRAYAYTWSVRRFSECYCGENPNRVVWPRGNAVDYSGSPEDFWVTELAILIAALRDFPQFLQKNAGIVPSLGNDSFPSNVAFICHLTIPCYTVCLVTAS